MGFQHGGFTDEQLGWYLKLQAHPDMVWISAPLSTALQDNEGQHITRDLQRITGEEAFLSADVEALWRACGHYPRALSMYPLGGGSYSDIALYREVGRPLFTERETRIAHIMMSEVPWLRAFRILRVNSVRCEALRFIRRISRRRFAAVKEFCSHKKA